MLNDVAAERAVLSGICHYGADAYYDIIDMVQETTFTIDSNAMIFKCLKYILEKDDTVKIDTSFIMSAAKSCGCTKLLTDNDEVLHLKAVLSLNVDKDNVRKFAAKIRKLQIARMLKEQLSVAQDGLMNVTGDESILKILNIAEDAVLNFTELLSDHDNSPEKLGKGIKEYLNNLAENPVEQIGISTGFPMYDAAIGGGLRKATVSIIGARAKVGKSIISDNVGYHIAANLGIPVLNMDTEMVREDHVNRTLAMMTEVEINDIETGRFASNATILKRVTDAGKKLENVPYYHRAIAGMPFEDQLAVMRRWIMKDVGLNQDGTAKDCVILYDYLKLMDANGISADLKEYQLLGFMMTTLHNFCTRYKVPILAFIQLNRDGINKESTDSASGSDRIIWLCSNFTIFKRKSDEEIAEDGAQNGNRKLVPLISRHGPSMDEGDYINCFMQGKYAKIVEGKTKFELKNINNDDGFVVDDQTTEIPFNDEQDI